MKKLLAILLLASSATSFCINNGQMTTDQNKMADIMSSHKQEMQSMMTKHENEMKAMMEKHKKMMEECCQMMMKHKEGGAEEKAVEQHKHETK